MPVAGLRERSLRVEKRNNANDLTRNAADPARQGRTGLPPRMRPEASQSGTGEDMPLWHGPRLLPAFVAQVMGQALVTGAPRAQPSVYPAHPGISSGVLFDRTA